MKWKFLSLSLTVFVMLLVVGCSNNDDVGVTDDYENVREVEWEFITEKGWNDNAKEDRESAEVKNVIADNDYELLDNTYVGKEILVVSFSDKENVVVGTPSILVDPENNEVVGYMLGE